MTDPRVTELDYDAIRSTLTSFVAWEDGWQDAYREHVPALLDRIEELERQREQMLTLLTRWYACREYVRSTVADDTKRLIQPMLAEKRHGPR